MNTYMRAVAIAKKSGCEFEGELGGVYGGGWEEERKEGNVIKIQSQKEIKKHHKQKNNMVKMDDTPVKKKIKPPFFLGCADSPLQRRQ